ncbi:MAG: tandem-95 repeat protein, partial [Vitreoscilla sp.]|nr:tandem-95 repeat protein [Vitreoscilla sp.]
GTWTYTPGPSYNGSDVFTVTVSDGHGGTATSTITIGITPVNDIPVAVNDAIATNEDTPVTIAVRGNDSDVDGDTLTVSAVTNGAHGTVVIDPLSGNPVYTPAANWNGTDTFTYTVSDGQGGSATATVTVTVAPVNDAPKFDDPTNPTFDPATGNYAVTTPEDTPVSGQVKGSDVDGDPLTYAKAADPAHGTVAVNPDGTWTYTPGPSYNGSDVFTVTVSDGHGGTATSTITIGITPVND